MKKVFQNLKYIKAYDVLSVFVFLLVLVPALIYKFYLLIRRKRLWLITEDGYTARDNGYYFFKYMRTEHKDFATYYVIDKKKHDYEKVEKYGNVVQFRSIKHWIYYLSSEYNISSQKNGNPAQALFYVLHVKLNLFNNRVFLQHGITINRAEYIFYNEAKFKYLICGAKSEYEYIKSEFGYPDDSVIYAGFSRFDSLVDNSDGKKQILIMPTWRNWLGRETNTLAKKEAFEKTEYYKNWNGLLNDPSFIEFIEKNNISVKFYPHIHMQKFLDCFSSISKNVEILSADNDIQETLRESSIMITDYSSVSMDFAYMGKPIIYYQFDRNEYREKQLGPGYFDYEKDGFGTVVDDMRNLVVCLKKAFTGSMFANTTKYIKRANSFFESRGDNNSGAIFKTLLEGKRTKELGRVDKVKIVLLFLSFLSCGLNIFTIELGSISVLPIMIAGFAIFVFRIIAREKTGIRISKTEMAFAALLIFFGVNLLFAYNTWRGVKVFGRILLICFSIWEIRCLAYSIKKEYVSRVFVVVSVIFLFSTLIYYFCGINGLGFDFNVSNTRLAGVMVDRKTPRLISFASTDPNITAIFLAIPLAYFMRQRITWKNCVILVGFSLLMALTMSRGAVVAIVCMLLAFLLFNRQRVRKRLMVLFIVATTLVITSFAVNTLINKTEVKEEKRNFDTEVITDETTIEEPVVMDEILKNRNAIDKSIVGRLVQSASDNGSGRLTLWKRTIGFFLERPVNGIGIGNVYSYMKVKYKYEKYAHNTYLEMLAESGVIGIVLFGTVLMLIVVGCLRMRFKNISPLLFLSFFLPAIMFLSVFHHEVFYVSLLYIIISFDSYKRSCLSSRVSVLMPTLDTDKQYLKESIKSILSQTYNNYELIVVVDGGDDRDYIENTFKDERIKIINHFKTQGVAKSLNEAIRESTGKYLVRMDADDISKKDRLEKQVLYMENHPGISIAASFVKKIGHNKVFACNPFTSPKDIYAESFYVSPVIHPSVIIRASVFRDGKGFGYDSNYERIEDYQLWRRVMESGNEIAIMRYYGLYYRVHSDQVSATKRGEQSLLLNKLYRESLKELHLSKNDSGFLFMLSGRSSIIDKRVLKSFVKKAILQNKKYKKYDHHSFKKVMWAAYTIACIRNKVFVIPNVYFLSMCFKKVLYKGLGLLTTRDNV